MKWRQFWAERLPWHLLVGKNFWVPANLTIGYVFGGLLIFALALQLLTGLWLVMFYVPTPEMAFASIQQMLRQVSYGWLLRSLHTTGASAIFILLYAHIFRGLYYRSYQKPREAVWLLGVLLLWLLLAEAFSGYLLPWGQMSYWGATVVTNMLTALPGGETLVTWLRGDYVVSGVTLQRFFALHIIALPILLYAVIRLHIKALHHVGSGNPAHLPIDTRGACPAQCVPFYPEQFRKDFLAWLWYVALFAVVVFFMPRGFGVLIDALNERLANPWQTPMEIRPLWYMAPFYALLRAIPSKIGGVLTIAFALLAFAALPWLAQRRGAFAHQCRGWFLSLAAACYVGLTVIGLLPIYSGSNTITVGFVIIGVVALVLGL